MPLALRGWEYFVELVPALQHCPLTLSHGDLATVNMAVELSREEVLAAYRDACGPSYDAQAMRLALIGGLVWLGWNKALDVVEHPDEAKRARTRRSGVVGHP